jgi:hypothetical protein
MMNIQGKCTVESEDQVYERNMVEAKDNRDTRKSLVWSSGEQYQKLIDTVRKDQEIWLAIC